ncbi:hypothetical protein L6164_017766 [Bauhinia variegata]|uniref:Uncharacterized protein n=1 Tax=Bauhinia variegata TaxID=167791 RepID=A0ACB9N8U1_BAUVA|nr:hypothetical protein L6164_017766 [Bauhinia variegata]
MHHQFPITLTFLYLLCLAASQNTSSQEQEALEYRFACLDQSSIPPSSIYQNNLNNLMTFLSSDASTSNGFGNTTSGTDQSNNTVYGLYCCRGDTNTSLCHSCVQNSIKLIKQRCPNNASAALWKAFCFLRYSNQNFFGKLTVTPRIPMLDTAHNFTSAGEFDSDARMLMNGLIQTAAERPLMFWTHVFNINGTQKRYGWVQCSRDITSEQCRTCLSNMLEDVENCCEEKKVWRIFSPSCVVMYEVEPFLFGNTLPEAPTPQPAKKGSNKRKRIIFSLISGAVVGALLAISIYYLRKAKQTLEEEGPNPFSKNKKQIEREDSMRGNLPTMPLSIILKASGNFSNEYKLGQGGFGPVYKGVLPDGRQIAVKRLSKTSGQEPGLSLIIYAWKLWCDGKSLELMDPLLENSCSAVEVLKCIQIGLLCVQEDPADRPTMSSVVLMLGSQTMTLPKPRQPAFSVGRVVSEQESPSNNAVHHESINEPEVRIFELFAVRAISLHLFRLLVSASWTVKYGNFKEKAPKHLLKLSTTKAS